MTPVEWWDRANGVARLPLCLTHRRETSSDVVDLGGLGKVRIRERINHERWRMTGGGWSIGIWGGLEREEEGSDGVGGLQTGRKLGSGM